MSARISIGRYYSAASPIHALDPRVKIVATIGYMVSCLIVTNALELALAGAFVLAAIALARVPVSRLLAQLKPVVFFLVVTSLFNLLFVGTGTELVALGVLRITTGGVQAAALYTLRFLFLLLMGSLLMLTTQPMALTDAAERLLAPLARLGVPVSEGMLVLSIALRFVPILGEDARHRQCPDRARCEARGCAVPRSHPRVHPLAGAALLRRGAPRRPPRLRYGGALLHRRRGAHALPRAAARPARRHGDRGMCALPRRSHRTVAACATTAGRLQAIGDRADSQIERKGVRRPPWTLR